MQYRLLMSRHAHALQMVQKIVYVCVCACVNGMAKAAARLRARERERHRAVGRCEEREEWTQPDINCIEVLGEEREKYCERARCSDYMDVKWIFHLIEPFVWLNLLNGERE